MFIAKTKAALVIIHALSPPLGATGVATTSVATVSDATVATRFAW